MKESLAGDTLALNQSLRDNQTLVSSRQVYVLGFFRPGSSNYGYLGIWYKQIPSTVVWVANRVTPVRDSSGVLTVSPDGNLLLLNGNGSVIWRTNSSIRAESPLVQILDNGNLVIKEMGSSAEGSYLWQSFDYPSDTLLSGMKLGRDSKTTFNRIMTSWKKFEDPSPGEYTYGLEIYDKLAQLVVRMGQTLVFRSGIWYDKRFSGGPVVETNRLFTPVIIVNSEEAYYKYESVDNNTIQRTYISSTGLGQHLTWNRNQQQWVVVYTLQKDQCDNYNMCGPFSLCDISATPNCQCMTGFTPKSPEKWKMYESNDGCVRQSPLSCHERHKFLKYTAVKLPHTVNLSMKIATHGKECEETCLRNCSCNAYTIINTGDDGKVCLTWFGELIDVRITRTDYGEEFYLKVSASEYESITGHHSSRRRLTLIIALTISSVVFLLVLILLFRIRKMRKHKRLKKVQEGDWEENLDLIIYDLATVATATNQFSFQNKIGEGGFGPVYRGILPTGQEVAIKRLSSDSAQGINELKNEVLLISKLQHRNLVKLLGCCIHEQEMMLIYEFMAQRSLDAFIFDKSRRHCLGWASRFKIIEGIARGLLYLHQDSRLRIIHRDLKASNILLDNEMVPKISDFGMARAFEHDQAEAHTRVVVGTYGYISPEYAIYGKYSVKSDVFSFGVLVLEITSGEKNNGFVHPESNMNLLEHVWKLWCEGNVLELLDNSMAQDVPVDEVTKCIQIGLLCVQQLPNDRPTMSFVLKMLDAERSALPYPNEPGFFIDRSRGKASLSRKRRHTGREEVTITMLEGR